jgi:hypothetical protein
MADTALNRLFAARKLLLQDYTKHSFISVIPGAVVPISPSVFEFSLGSYFSVFNAFFLFVLRTVAPAVTAFPAAEQICAHIARAL